MAEHDKREALRRLIRSEDVQNALIFCNRKSEVDILYKSLKRHGFSVGALHGDMAQPGALRDPEKFKAGELRLLVCSDVAARGLDIGGLSHVFNFDVPHHAEDYVHRSGRTGRAGREGHAYTLASPEDRLAVEAIEKLTGGAIPRIVVPGLDVVQWAEGTSRARRGRGGAASRSRGGAKADDAKPREEKPRDKARTTAKTEERAPREAKTADRAPREAKAPGRPPRQEQRPQARVEQAPAPEPIRADGASRERKWREDDLGPSVPGLRGPTFPPSCCCRSGPHAAGRPRRMMSRTRRPESDGPSPGAVILPIELLIRHLGADGDGAATGPDGVTLHVARVLPRRARAGDAIRPEPSRLHRHPVAQRRPGWGPLPAFCAMWRLRAAALG